MNIVKGKQTATMTFRLDENIIQRLRSESTNRKISTNTLVGQALMQFLEWGMYAPSIVFVSVNKPVFVEVFGKLKQKEVVDIAERIGKDEVKNIALSIRMISIGNELYLLIVYYK